MMLGQEPEKSFSGEYDQPNKKEEKAQPDDLRV